MNKQNATISQSLELHKESLAQAIIDRQWSEDPSLARRYDAIGQAKCRQDVKYHLTYLSETIAADSPVLFAEYVAWAKVLFKALGIPIAELTHNLQIIEEVLSQKLAEPEAHRVIHTFIEFGLTHLPEQPEVLPSFIRDELPLASTARQYLQALLAGERYLATRLVMDRVEAGESIKDIYLHVFQRSQHEIGRLWQMNQVTVAQEHYCTAATQLIMAQLYPYIFTTQNTGPTMVATCIGGELHELGIRMVADFLEMEGWDTHYLGANTPARAVVQTVQQRRASLLAISGTMGFHVSQVADLIAMVRADNEGQAVKILVGGYPFNLDQELWRKVGANGYAPDAQTAIIAANELTQGRA